MPAAHFDGDEVATALYDPAAAETHPLALRDSWYWPGEHDEQAEEPESENFPRTHGPEVETMPALEQKVPAGDFMHDVEPDAG